MYFFSQCEMDKATGQFNWTDASDNYGIMLVKDTATLANSMSTVADITGGGTNYELNSGAGNTNGYYAGFGNSGRKSLAAAQRSVVQDVATGKALYKYGTTITWTALQAAAGNVGFAVVYRKKAGAATDADLNLCFWFPFSPADVPNGNDYVLEPDSTAGMAQGIP